MRAKRPAEAPASDLHILADRLREVEQHIEQLDQARDAAPARPPQFDQKVIQAIVGAVEQRLNEHAAQVDQRLTGMQMSVTAALGAKLGERLEQETGALRSQVVHLQREFAASVAQIVSEQVAAQAAPRMQAMETAVREQVALAVAPLRTEVSELRRRLGETENTMTEFVSAISDTVRNAAGRAPVYEEPFAEPEREAAPAERRSRSPRSSQPAARPTPQHLDLRVLRKRLSDAEQPAVAAEQRYGFLPIPTTTQRRGPVPVKFPVAS